MYDNFAKNVDLAKPVASLAQDQKWPVKTYVFVSSGTHLFLNRKGREMTLRIRCEGETRELWGASRRRACGLERRRREKGGCLLVPGEKGSMFMRLFVLCCGVA